MATKFSTVYDVFFGGIEDDMYVSMTVAETEADLYNFLIRAIIDFRGSKISLLVTDLVLQEFSNTLGIHEIVILAEIMKREWLERQINKVDLLQQGYTDDSFRRTSQAEHIKSLTAWLEVQMDKVIKMKLEYSKLDSGYSLSYTGLAGKGV